MEGPRSARLPGGKRGFAYGGQFGDDPNDGNFVADGLIRRPQPHPGVQEVMWVYRPVVVSLSGDRLTGDANRRSFADLSDLVATWELLVEGGAMSSSGVLDGRLD